jgi:tripartite-type tricarboxylate transporter receptor subunit TctC
MKVLKKLAFILVATLCFQAAALAQAFPVKPIRLVIGFPPGGTDLTARIISPYLSEGLGQPVVFDYRPGANGAIGADAVARATPDGYTLLFGTAGIMVVAAVTTAKLPYDTRRDFTPISITHEGGMFLTVPASDPANTVEELIERARRAPGKLSFGSNGVGSIYHLMAEGLSQVARIELLHVPYKGVAPIQQAALSNEITFYFGSGAVFPLAAAGKVKLIAYMDSKRSPLRSGVPAIVESLPEYQRVPGWLGFFGPASLPGPVLARLNGELVKAGANAELRGKLADLGYTMVSNSPEAAAAMLRRDIDIVARIVKTAGIKLE